MILENFQVFLDVRSPVPEFDKKLENNVKTLADLYPSDISDSGAFISEYFVFCATLQEQTEPMMKSISDASKFCYKQYSDYGLFPSVWKAFKLFNSASPSVCASGRSFSRLKLVKTYLRNKMSQDRLQNLMLISNESDVAFQLDLDKISKKWAHIKKRRILL